MRPLRKVFVLCALVGFVANARAQGQADFSGSWVIDVDKTAVAAGRAPGTGRAGAAGAIAIAQDASTLTITYTNGTKSVYRLDGKEVTHKATTSASAQGLNPRMNLPNPGTDEIYKSHWQNSKLVTTMSGHGANGPTMATEVRWLEGGWMVVKTTREAQTGNTVQTSYWKKSKSSE